MKKNGVTIDCTKCQLVGREESASFDVVVPIRDDETCSAGLARLHCTVSERAHLVELTEWRCGATSEGQAGDDRHRRLTGALGFVQEHRLCGNGRLCPKEVVRTVKQNARD